MSQQKPMLGELPDFTRFPHWPVAVWPCIKAGNLIDLSGNKLTGTLVADTHWVPGKFGSALSFDGNGDCVDVATSPSLDALGDNVTIIMWLYTDEALGDIPFTYRQLWRLRVSSTDQIYAYYQSTGGIRIFNDIGDAGTIELLTGCTVSIGQWYQLVFVFDSTNVSVYKNGVFGDSDPLAATLGGLGASRTFRIAFGTNNLCCFHGLIDNVMIFNHALTAFQIAYLHRNPWPWFVKDEVSPLYVPAAGGMSMPLLMQQMNQFNGGQAA